jgi:hypothetical protein
MSAPDHEPIFDSVTLPDCEGRGFIRIERGRNDDFWIAIQHDGASARARSFYVPGQETLHDYFQKLAQYWKGWAGMRPWESPGFRLWATHDGRSHVVVEAALCPYSKPESWSLTAFVNVAPGELEGIALELREMFTARDKAHHS